MNYKLEEICLKITDGSHYSPSNDTNSDIPMLSVKDMREFDFDYDNCKHISYEEFDKMQKYDCVPKIGDVLVAKDGSYLKEMFVNRIDNKKAILSSIAIFRPNQEIIYSDYLCYLLKSPKVFNYTKENCVSGTALPRIILKAFKDIPLFIPSLKEQSKIVKILSSIDNKIKLNNQINNNLHEIAENYFLEVSKNGEEVKLEELLYDIQSGSREKGGAVTSGIPSIGAEKIEKLGIYNFESEKYISEQYFQKMKNGIIKSGDVLLYKDGAYAGKVSMALNDFPHKQCAVNEHVFILRTENNWANYYLYFLLYNSKSREQLQAMASSKAAQPGLNQKEVKDVKVMIPSKDKIKKFEKNVKTIVEKIIENSIENRNLEQLRDTLLPILMNGEIDLENVEI